MIYVCKARNKALKLHNRIKEKYRCQLIVCILITFSNLSLNRIHIMFLKRFNNPLTNFEINMSA